MGAYFESVGCGCMSCGIADEQDPPPRLLGGDNGYGFDDDITPKPPTRLSFIDWLGLRLAIITHWHNERKVNR